MILALTSLLLQVASHTDVKTYTLREFDRIGVSAGIRLDCEVGPANSVTLEATPDQLKEIEVKVEGRELAVSTHSAYSSSAKPIILRVKTPSLVALEISGGVLAKVNGLKSKSFNLSASGGSKALFNGTCGSLSATLSGGSIVKGLELKGESALLMVSGASRFACQGKTSRLSIEATGAAIVDCTRLEASTATLSVSGASQVALKASKQITGEVSGASSVKYTGKPKTQIESSGASSVSAG